MNESPELMREDLDYDVYNTGGGIAEIYQICAKLREEEPFHGGNVHWAGPVFHTREEAIQWLNDPNNRIPRHAESAEKEEM